MTDNKNICDVPVFIIHCLVLMLLITHQFYHLLVNIHNHYMAVSHKDSELPNPQI